MQCHIGIEKITFSSQCSKLYNAPTRNDYSHKKTIIKSKQAQKYKSEPVFL